MLRLLGIIACAASLGAQQAVPDAGVVVGTVVRADSRDALAGAKVTVTSSKTAPPISVVTDSAGHFKVSVPLGLVSIRVEMEGFFGPARHGDSPAFAAVSAEVARDRPSDVRIELVPGAAVSGRILDASGQPSVRTPVGVARRVYRNGAATLDFDNGGATDDRGQFRVFGLPPGDYVLAAFRKSGDTSAMPPGALAAVTTFYPGATSAQTARVMNLKGGEDLAGLDMQLLRMPTYSISGQVLSLLRPPGDGAAPGRARTGVARLVVMPHDVMSVPAQSAGEELSARPDGSFQVRGLLPGDYDVIARLPAAAGWGSQNGPDRATSPWAIGRAFVSVAGNVDDLTIAVRPGTDVTGTVTLDGRATPAAVRVTLVPDDESAMFSSFYEVVSTWAPFLDASGGFAIPLVPEGRYRVRVGLNGGPVRAAAANVQGLLPPKPTPLPANAYVADVLAGGRSVFDSGVTLGSEPLGSLEVRLKSDGGSVRGTVTDAGNTPDPGALVVLVPALSYRGNAARYCTAATDGEGRFVVNRVAPGAYTVFAFHDVQAGAYENAQFLEPLLAKGVAVTVASLTSATVTLEAIR